MYLAEQQVPVTVPRVRNRQAGVEVPLTTDAPLQAPRAQDAGLCARVLGGLSSREYHAAADAIPDAFGLAKSSVSRRFVHASARALRQRQERRLDDHRWPVLLLDGKTFASDQLVVALGVATTGKQRVLGLVQTATENTTVCSTLLRDLETRGFTAPQGLLVVLDGAKGLRAVNDREHVDEEPVHGVVVHGDLLVARIRPDRRTGQFQAIQRTLARPGGGDIRRLGEHRHERSVAERVAIIQVFVAESTYTRRRSSAATGCVTRVGSR